MMRLLVVSLLVAALAGCSSGTGTCGGGNSLCGSVQDTYKLDFDHVDCLRMDQGGQPYA